MKQLLKKNTLFVAYYLALLVELFSMINPHQHFSMSMRMFLFVLIVFPALFEVRILPAVLLLFCGINASSFSAILPTSDFYFLLIVAAGFFINNRKGATIRKELLVLLFFLLLALFHLDLTPMLFWAFLAILLSELIQEQKDLELLAFSFVVLTVFLCLLFLLYRGEFAVRYGDKEAGMERSYWINANVFGASISAGAVLATAYLTKVLRFTRTRFGVIVCSVAVLLASICLPLNASRGAFSSFVVPSLVLILISNTKVRVKIVITSFIVLVTGWLFLHGFYDLLQYRIEIDETRTGDRTLIWASKMADFYQIRNPLHWLFGIGQTDCLQLGVSNRTGISTHNDFLTAFFAYGLTGFVVFVYSVIVYPIRNAKPGNKWPVVGLLLYLVIEGFVLEPVFRGYFTEIMFLMFVLKYGDIMDSPVLIPIKKKRKV